MKKIKVENVDIVIETCSDGEFAVKKFKEINKIFSLFNIHLMIMDFNMLVMNGDEAFIKVIFIYIDYWNDKIRLSKNCLNRS
mgnify:CR=1 FL=1